jgi:cell division protein FtsB
MQIKTRKVGWIVGVVVIACAVSVLRGPHGLTGPLELFQQIRELQKSNRDLEIEIAEKQERLRRLAEGSSEAELEVKKRLKYLKPGERQMVLPNAPASPSTSEPAPAASPDVRQPQQR